MNSNLHSVLLHIQFTATSRRLVHLVYSLGSNIFLRPIKLEQNSWNTTDLKIIGLFLSSFWFTTQFFSVSQRRNIFVARWKNYSISCLQSNFYMSSSLSFFCCFLIDFLIGYVSRYSTRMKYRCIGFRFCPPKSIIIIIHHVFSQSRSRLL